MFIFSHTQILAKQFLRHVVKMECWDAMETVGRTIYAFGERLEVSNYPLLKMAPERKAELQRVMLQRRIQNAGV
jgi:hypothetical protein